MRAQSYAAALALLAGCGGKSLHRLEQTHPVAPDGAGGEGGGAGAAAVSCTREMHEDVRLERQRDAAALRGVSLIDGDLTVTGDVTDLGALGCLREVTGDLHVFEARSLTSLAGLENLTRLGGALYVGWGCDWDAGDCIGNPSLRSIDALGGLTTAGGVYISAVCAGDGGSGPCAVNAVLERAVFEQLNQTSTIWVYANPALTEARFDAVPRLAGFDLTGNARLSSATFAALESVEDFFYVGENPDLPSLAGFSRLARVPAGLDIVHSNFTSLAGLEALASTTQLYLDDDPLLADLSSLSNLTELSYLSVSGTALTNLHGLEGISAFGVLSLRDNPELESLTGLERVERLNELELANNAVLTNLHALAGLQSVSADGFSIVDNPTLPTCEADWLRDHVGVENIGAAPNIAGNYDAGVCAP